MAIDPVTNFAKTVLDSGIASGATSLTVAAGSGVLFPDPVTLGAYNVVIWDQTSYADPADDPNKEIVRVTNKVSDTFAITRGQESTSDVNHNTAGKAYGMILALTKKTIDDIRTLVSPIRVDGEVLGGACDDANTDFTLAHTPISGTVRLYNGIRIREGAIYDYTLSGTNVTTTYAPTAGSSMMADYYYL